MWSILYFFGYDPVRKNAHSSVRMLVFLIRSRIYLSYAYFFHLNTHCNCTCVYCAGSLVCCTCALSRGCKIFYFLSIRSRPYIIQYKTRNSTKNELYYGLIGAYLSNSHKFGKISLTHSAPSTSSSSSSSLSPLLSLPPIPNISFQFATLYYYYCNTLLLSLLLLLCRQCSWIIGIFRQFDMDVVCRGNNVLYYKLQPLRSVYVKHLMSDSNMWYLFVPLLVL